MGSITRIGALFLMVMLIGTILPFTNQNSAQAQTTRNLPDNDKVRFFIGQTSPDVSQFRSQVINTDPDFNVPGGVTLYTHINPGQCNGTTGNCDLGNSGNVMDFPATLNEYPNAALAVGLFLSDTPSCTNQPLRALIGRDDADLVGGLGQQYRDKLDDLITYLKNTNREVYLRIGYEFDGPWNCYNRDFYIEAFRYVKGRIDTLGASNIATVWQSATYPIDGNPQFFQDFSNPNHFNNWYPGDQYVDWVGISTFYYQDFKNRQFACLQESINPVTLYDRALNFARNRNKPVFIGESTPVGYQNDTLTASCILTNQQSSVDANTIWNEWYADYFAYINDNADVIRAISYINSDWEAINQFNCAPGAPAGSPNCTDGYWGDSRIQTNSIIYNRFKTEINRSIFENGTGGSNPTPIPATQTPVAQTPTAVTPTQTPIVPPPPTGRTILMGQSNRNAWDDFVSVANNQPDGGSVYYEVRSGTWVSNLHREYADLIANNNRIIQVGISWKDNPPGWNGGDVNSKAAASRQASQDIANGVYDSQFDTLIDHINSNPNATYYLRVGYEVSTFFHCTNSSCNSYKDAFEHIVQLIDSRTNGANVQYVYHPVRGEYQQLYPGAVTDWIGVSIFNHELCLPIYNLGTTFYNGTPGVGYNTSTQKCMGYIIQNVNGNPNAVPYEWEYDQNVLGMMKFAKDNGKPMILSESFPMNFAAGQNANGTENDATVALWMDRYFGLMNYNGPLPNEQGNHDLSNVIKSAVYMNIDTRYGWDGKKPGQTNFEFPIDADWHNNGKISAYIQAQQAFCNGLVARGFATKCN